MTKFFNLRLETSATWWARLQYLWIFSPRSRLAEPQALEKSSKILYDWQSVSISWYRVPLWNLRPDIISCRNVAVSNLRSCVCGAPSLTRGRVSNLQCNHSIVRVAQNQKPYFTVSSETPQPGGPGSRIYIPQEQGGPIIPPGTGFRLRRLLWLAGLRWRYSNPPPTWMDRFLYI
jgi:hypothetical protein